MIEEREARAARYREQRAREEIEQQRANMIKEMNRMKQDIKKKEEAILLEMQNKSVQTPPPSPRPTPTIINSKVAARVSHSHNVVPIRRHHRQFQTAAKAIRCHEGRLGELRHCGFGPRRRPSEVPLRFGATAPTVRSGVAHPIDSDIVRWRSLGLRSRPGRPILQ